jgi:hypothetical protein
MDERENRRKAKEREQQSSGATDRYTQVEYTCSFAVVLWPLNSQLTFSVAPISLLQSENVLLGRGLA